MSVAAKPRRGSLQRRPTVWLLALLVPVGLFGFWWWIGGIRLSNPLPEMRSEIERFVPPEGSELVSIEEDGLDRACFLQCATRVVEARFVLPRLPAAERCTLAEAAVRDWSGDAELFPGENAVACYIEGGSPAEHPEWTVSARVSQDPRGDGSDLSISIAEP